MSDTVSYLLSARSSYAKLQPVLAEGQRVGLRQAVVTCGAALVHRYGNVADTVAADFPDLPQTRIYCTYEGASLETSAKETGSLLASLVDHYSQTKPRLVVVIADRHETVAASLAAAYQNIPVAHLQGGERSGNIDDRVRDLNSVLALLHFPSTPRAAVRLALFTRPGARVYRTGCPSIDLAKVALADLPVVDTDVLGGVGPRIDLRHPFLVMLLHPETERPEAARVQMLTVLEAIGITPLPRLVLWPGPDAGAELGAKVLREWTQAHPAATVHLVRTIPPRRFLRLLQQTTVLVGNSSAGIREASYLGTPVVNIGDRQVWREQAVNVIDTPFQVARIQQAITEQMRHGPYPSSTLYGTGTAARQIVEAIRRSVEAW